MDPLLWALIACVDEAPAPPPTAPVEDEPIEPSPWVFETTATDEAPVDTERLGRALDAAIEAVLAYDAEPVIADYEALFAASAEPTCPTGTSDPYGNLYWIDACTTTDGTYFGGYLSTYAYDGTYDPYSSMYLYGDQLAGNIVVDDALGSYDLEGVAMYLTGTSADGSAEIVQSYLVGGFSHASPAATGWLQDAGNGIALSVVLVGYRIPVIDGTAVIVDAAVDVEVDGEPFSVQLDYLELGSESIGTLCADEPGGVASIRDPDGRWVDVTFHGPDLAYGTTPGDPQRCEGCGDATLDGEPVGEVCASFEPWYQWEKLQ